MTSARIRNGRLALAYLAFISLGLPDAVLGVAWPSMRATFGVSLALLAAPVAVAAASYFASGLFAGELLRRWSLGTLLAVSTCLVGVGVFGIAAAPAFAVVLLASAVIGLGSGAIDSALNFYVARHFAAKHMSWLHAAYAAGATAGPSVMTLALTQGGTWRVGYGAIGGALSLLAVAFVVTRSGWTDAPDSSATTAPDPTAQAGSFGRAIHNGRVWLQVAIFFVYACVEVTAGQWSYSVLIGDRGLPTGVAGAWVAAYWGGLFVGRMVSGLIVERVGQVALLRGATIGAFVFAVLFAASRDYGVLALPLLSASLAAIYPGMMAETPRRLAEHARHAVGFQVSAATLGVAAGPAMGGLIATRVGLGAVPVFIAFLAAVLFVLHEALRRAADD